MKTSKVLKKLPSNQAELLFWLLHHKNETPTNTWNLLFKERESEYPDRCIEIYDALSVEDKIKIEKIFAEIF